YPIWSKRKDESFLQDLSKEMYNEEYVDCENVYDTWSRTWTDQKNQIYHYTEFCAKAELLDYAVLMYESEQFPPYLRVENMIVNSQVFGHIYKCPVGGKQNPNIKCPPFPIGSDFFSSETNSGLIPVV
ncbi:hypothetical protein L9F63_026053, partial [Diploptera punctata]